MNLFRRSLAALAASALLLTAAVVPATSASATVCPTATVAVSTAGQLTTALGAASPGDVIELAPGTYAGNFAATNKDGSAGSPIWLCGPSTAIIDGGSITGNYSLHINNSDYWHLLGFTVAYGSKGVMVDSSSHVTVEGLTVHGTGDEAIHLRIQTTDSLVTGNTIYDTGNRREKFGEGVYVGSADSNWGNLNGGLPDRSDRNTVSYNTIYDTTAESIDIKEGTADGSVIGNTFDGSSQTAEGADSWMDVKGNGYLIQGNSGVHSLLHGYETHRKNLTKNGLGDWGKCNVFDGNAADVQGVFGGPDPVLGYYLHDFTTAKNVILSNNTATNVDAVFNYGVSYGTVVPCTP